MEKVSGTSLNDYLRKKFFQPLGLASTGVYQNATPPKNAAQGYAFRQDQPQPARNWDMSWTGGAGSLYSTTGDLWRWTEALQSGRVLSPASLQTMLAEVPVPKRESSIRYGMGLWHSEFSWLPVIAHNGGVDGFQSLLLWFPDQKVTMVVLENAFPVPPTAGPNIILNLAADAFLAPEIAAHTPKVDSAIHPKTYPAYVGRYDYHGAIQTITTENGHLYAQLTNQNRFEIFPSAPDTFFFKIVGAQLVFNRDEKGGVVSVTHTQNGRTFTARKIQP